MKGPSQQISFRLAAEYSEELEERAKIAGVSRGDYARQILISVLTENHEKETRNHLAEMQDELEQLRQDLWSSVTALLAYAGTVSAEEASAWVDENLMQ